MTQYARRRQPATPGGAEGRTDASTAAQASGRFTAMAARGMARVAASLAMAAVLAQPQVAQARQSPVATADGMGTIAVQQLPNEARLTLQRIEAGGPYPYAKDGTRFGNYERLLPRRPRGYYREYTVARPNSRNRGPKRIVCGGEQRAVDDCYYTEDHYNSFKRITR